MMLMVWVLLVLVVVEVVGYLDTEHVAGTDSDWLALIWTLIL